MADPILGRNSYRGDMNAGLVKGVACAPIGALNVPRPLGVIERASGLASGLDNLQTKLESLLARIEGIENEDAEKATAPTSGLVARFADAEAHLRACLSLADELYVKF